MLHRNNSLSPFLQRKYSLQNQQPRPLDQNASRWRNAYGTSRSAQASPNLDAQRRYQSPIPGIDIAPVRLSKGHTSPIGKKIYAKNFYSN